MQHYFKRLFVLFCVVTLLACSSTRVLLDASSAQPITAAALSQLEEGSRLVVILFDKSEPVTGEFLGVDEVSLRLAGAKQQNGQTSADIIIALKNIQRLEQQHYSWVKNSFLVSGILLVIAAASVKSSLDNMGGDCYSCTSRPSSSAPSL
jgi:hypothetical protein